MIKANFSLAVLIRLLTIGIFLLGTSPNLILQNYFSEPHNFTRSARGGTSVVDLNGNGVLELVQIAGDFFDGLVSYELNADNIGCEEAVSFEGFETLLAINSADFNNDGFTDFLVRGWTETDSTKISIFFNDANGNSVSNQTVYSSDTMENRSAFLNDFNGDGHVDIFIEDYWSHFLYTNNGNGEFADSISLNYTGFLDDPFDIDNDGDLDLIYSVISEGTFLVLNENQSFINELPLFDNSNLPTGFKKLTDFNGNDRLDILQESSGGLLWTEWDENGTLLSTTNIEDNFSAYAMETFDYDADGDLDIVCAGTDFFSGNVPPGLHIWTNDGIGNFDLSFSKVLEIENALELRILDMNDDGIQDILLSYEIEIGGSERNRTIWFENSLSNPFLNDHNFTLDAITWLEIIPIDLFSDYLPELVAYTPWHISVIENDGQGNFCNSERILDDTFIKDVKCFDANGDGLNDIAVLSDDPILAMNIYINNGNNNYAPINLPMPLAPCCTKIDLADFNQDGAMDIFFRRLDEFYIYENLGNGQFQERNYPIDIVSVQYDIRNFDQDNFPDIIHTSNDEVWWYRNQGNFSFDDPIIIPLTRPTTSLIITDFDQDQDEDILYQNNLDSGTPNIFFLENIGQETFVPETIVYTGTGISDPIETDFNNDGYPDFISIGNASITFLLNTLGSFTKFSTPIQNHNGRGGVVSDVDADGDEDLLVDGQLHILKNLTDLPFANFEVDDCPDVIITNTSISNQSQSTYTWNYGDGTSSSGIEASPNYTQVGEYLLSLEVCNNANGICDTISTEIDFYHIAEIDHETSVIIGNEILFNNQSVGFTNFSWVFGDGNISTEQSPSHLYAAPGVYQVEAFLTDSAIADCTTVYSTVITVEALSSIEMIQTDPSIYYVSDYQSFYFNDIPSNTEVIISNVAGQVIYSSTTIDSNTSLHLPNISKGVYFISTLSSSTGDAKSYRVLVH